MSIARYTAVDFPPYSFVPGFAPHPVSDPAGHMYGVKHVAPDSLQPENWRGSEVFLYGVDLFNYHYYWESHEVWESLWIAARRSGTTADFLKGLIKLAAAAVKAREGNSSGVVRHTKRAIELFDVVAASLEQEKNSYCGANLMQLKTLAGKFCSQSEDFKTPLPRLELPLSIQLEI